MKQRTLFILLMMALWLCPAVASRGQMPRGSFLVKPAHSVAQLAAQVQSNRIVASRYERHFGVTAEQFARYAQNQLGLRRLTRAGSYRVYFIKSDGTVGSRVRRLRRGTPVFLHLRSGKPVLLGECGNPMQAVLPGLAPPPVATLPPRVTPPSPPRKPETPLPEPPVQTLALEAPTAQAPLPLELVVLTTWQADPMLSSLEPALPPETPALKPRRTHLFPLAFLALLGAFHEGTRPTPPAPIPEPAPVAVLGAGIVLLAGLRARHTRD